MRRARLGAARQALTADPQARLVAMGDTFGDRLTLSLKSLKADSVGSQVDVPPDRQFTGFDAYRHVIEASDVVLLATPPHFRPAHLKAAISAGKHVFAEKPVAVDAAGVRSVIETCKEAARKNLSVVSGLCYRYHPGMRATFDKIHEGIVGDIVAMQTSYDTNGLWMHPRQPSWSDMEWQVRNWLYFTWLSGDFNVEQHVHSLDKTAWAMKDQYPIACSGTGGRQSRTGPEYGNIFDHMAVVYEYPNGVKTFSRCRQQDGCSQGRQRSHLRDEGASGRHGIPGVRPGRQGNLAVPQNEGQYVPGGARRALCQYPQRQADQQRPLHDAQHHDGHHGTHGGVHGTTNHVGRGLELEGRPHAAELSVGTNRCPPGRQARPRVVLEKRDN